MVIAIHTYPVLVIESSITFLMALCNVGSKLGQRDCRYGHLVVPRQLYLTPIHSKRHPTSVHTQFIGHLQFIHPSMPHLCRVDDKASILPKREGVVCGHLGPILVPGEGGSWVSRDTHIEDHLLPIHHIRVRGELLNGGSWSERMYERERGEGGRGVGGMRSEMEGREGG